MAFDNIKLEKGLYTTKKGFTGSLEEIDPSANYAGTEFEGLDAYQRQLKRFDIKVFGTDSDTVSKFFKSSDASALFPEYVARAVRQGVEETDIVPKLVATTTKIDSMDYRALESIAAEDNKDLGVIAEGASIPETYIQTKSTLTQLFKRGRMLVASYEAIKFQKLDLFTITLKQIGAYIARCQLWDAINMLSETNRSMLTASTKIAYSDLVNFWNFFSPYTMTTLLVGNKDMTSLLNLSEMKDSAAGLNFHSTGKMITPLGAELLRTSYFPEGTIIGIDKNYALEKVQVGDIHTDFDKLIDRQLERAAITTIAGFSKIFDDAIGALYTLD